MLRWLLAGDGWPAAPAAPAAEDGGLPAGLLLSSRTVQYSWLAWLSCAWLPLSPFWSPLLPPPLPPLPPLPLLALLSPRPASAPVRAAC